jgi:hypothetical protein
LLDSFHYGKAGDAEFLYNLIRLKKPANIFEIGSGNSTLMAIQAIKRNQAEDPTYQCQHLCVEPYEMPLQQTQGEMPVPERCQ